MSAIKLSTPSSGSISLSPADTSSNLVIQVPAVTATMAIDGPAFSASSNVGQTLSNLTTTKIEYNVENWDTNSNYDPSTNYRFTPTVAGYYQINASTRINGSTASGGAEAFLVIYKNGTAIRRGTNWGGVTSNFMTIACSAVVFCNGSTDYIEIYVNNATGSSSTVSSNETMTYFDGTLVRAA
jgi:hypothetical protein